MPDKNEKTQRVTRHKYKFNRAWNLENTPYTNRAIGLIRICSVQLNGFFVCSNVASVRTSDV